MPGSEPMNPRDGQRALGGTLDGWARLDEPTAAQRMLIKLAYRGLDPTGYSRYGVRQWAAPLPTTRVIVKDPFAMLSIPGITSAVAAVPVLVYRHPAAVLRSYRRMGWSPDFAEVNELPGLPGVDRLAGAQNLSEVRAMAEFWRVCHEVALADLDQLPDFVVVSHAELAASGEDGMARLRARLRLPRHRRLPVSSIGAPADDDPGDDDSGELHRFDRDPRRVAEYWRGDVDQRDLDQMEGIASSVMAELESRRVLLTPNAIANQGEAS